MTELHLASLRDRYLAGSLTPTQLVDELAPALDQSDAVSVLIHRVPIDVLRATARTLERSTSDAGRSGAFHSP